jgi:hypothetical protein
MAILSFPANPTVGDQYTDHNGKVWEFDGVKWDVAKSESIKQFTGVKVFLANPFFLNNTLTPVIFDGEEIDTGNFFNFDTPTVLTIPRTGYYRIHMSLFTGQEGFGASYTIQLKRNNINLLNTNMAAYQTGVYDEVLLLNVGDTISAYASETDSVGSIESDSFLEITLQGYTFGDLITPGFGFSGVKATLQADVSTTDIPTAIIWTASDIEFNTNANEAGNVYWTNTNPTIFTVSTTGYYRINAFFETNIDGSSDSYTITIRKNGTDNLETITLGGNESVELDETYQLDTTDYLEVVISNTESTGAIKQIESFFQMIRLGV